MPDLPSGTVTFLFTDIEGSTRLLNELGAEAYGATLAEHRRTLREAFVRHGGVEVDTQGDAFFIAFAQADGALTAAGEAQQALASSPIRVRVGLHTGTPHLAKEGYVGRDVHLGARICAAAHGGQVVFSQATRDAVGAAQAAGIADLGLHRLKDLEAAVRLYQLGEEEFPALRSLNATNLPVQPNPLIGRERELREVLALARNGIRAITLTGPGGTGKTRLGLQAASELVTDFSDGVFWIPLAPLGDPDLVLTAIEQTLGARVRLADHLDEKRTLLLLDNFEHLMAAAAGLAGVLASCPNVKLLVTSRAPLRIAGEREYAVEPLSEDHAVRLFRERAAVADPINAVREICRRLDGLPLAIELAAARTRLLAPDKLLERLEKRLPLLTAAARDAPERQRTLRATIEWSYDLLEDDERILYARLAAFAGSFTLEAAEQVCDAGLETLESLVEKSLLRRSPNGRLGLLETIREYANERFEQSPEADHIRRRHAEFFLALAESAHVDDDGKHVPGGLRLELVIPEIDNFRAALEWADRSDAELALRLAVALTLYWVTNSPAEGRRWLSALIERNPNASGSLRARALRDLGGVVYIVGEFEDGTRLYEASLAEFRRLGDELSGGLVLIRLGIEAARTGDQARARVLGEEGLEISRRYGSKWGEAQALSLLGDLAFQESRHEEAFALLEQSASRAEEIGFGWWQSNALRHLAEYALMLHRPADARAPAAASLSISTKLGDRQATVWGLALIAWLAAESGLADRAGRIWGAIEAEGERGRIGQWEGQRDGYSARLLAVAGPEFEAGRTEGQAMSLSEAVEYALRSGA